MSNMGLLTSSGHHPVPWATTLFMIRVFFRLPGNQSGLANDTPFVSLSHRGVWLLYLLSALKEPQVATFE